MTETAVTMETKLPLYCHQHSDILEMLRWFNNQTPTFFLECEAIEVWVWAVIHIPWNSM